MAMSGPTERVRKILVSPLDSIWETMEVINRSGLEFALVVDKKHHLLGVVTDGDLRRAVLRKLDLGLPIQEIMSRSPIAVRQGTSRGEMVELARKTLVKHFPVVDLMNRIVDVILIRDLFEKESIENPVVIMAGGLGTRLRPLTSEVPKPMLRVGERPILETILRQFKEYGFNNFLVSVNYKAEIIIDYFQDGRHLGVNIEYIREDQPLGTAGALGKIREKINKPLILMNGDILTRVDFCQLLDFHLEQGSELTIASRPYEHTVPYGVLQVDRGLVYKLEEKPTQEYVISGGIYVINPGLMDMIPENTKYDVTDLIQYCIKKGIRVGTYPIREYWMDIGQVQDYYSANDDFENILKKFNTGS